MLKRIFITLFFCSISIFAFAQVDDKQVSEGSIYSQYGIGMPVDYGSSSADGLGVWGVSFIEPLVPDVANPAHWGSTVYGMATGGIDMTNYHAKDNTGDANNSLLSVNHFQLQLPIYKGQLGVSASFKPLSRYSFENIEIGEQITGSGTAQDTLNFETVNIGDGGINQIELGLGWRINQSIAVGYAASLVYASIDNSFSTTFYENSSLTTIDNSFAQVNTTYQTSGTSFGHRFGAQLTLPSLIKENDRLNVGMAVRLPVTIDADKEQESIFVSGNPDDPNSDIEEKISSGDIKVPLGLSGGITYEASERFSITAEGRYEKWSDYKNQVDVSPVNVSFADRFKIGGGVRYFPSLSGSDRFLSQFKYRLGASYDTGHLQINEENIDTIMFTGGLGIISPTQSNNFRSSIDISLYYGIRGTKSMNLVKENIWGVKLSLNLAELFFFRPKLQ